MAKMHNMISKSDRKKMKEKANFNQLPHGRKGLIYQKLLDLLSTDYYKSVKIKIYKNRPVAMYMKIPFLVGVEYDLISLGEFPVFSKFNCVTETKLEKVGNEFYAWVRPHWRKNKMELFIKGKYIPAEKIFGDHINTIAPELLRVLEV